MRVLDAFIDVWHLRRRAMVVCWVAFAAILVLLGALAVVLHATKQSTTSKVAAPGVEARTRRARLPG